MASARISVVIPTYNRVHVLKNCLQSLENQNYNRDLFEVIVVNDGSTDSTQEFLEDFRMRTKTNFNFIRHENRGVSFSRNVGIENARGEYIAFTDDDCLLPENWLSRMDLGLESIAEDVAGVGGPLECFYEGNRTFLTDFIHYLDEFNHAPVIGKYFVLPVHTSRLRGGERIAYLRTSNAVFRRSCLKEVGGFDVGFRRPGGEDPDLCYRLLSLHYRFLFDRELVARHAARETFASYFRSIRDYIEGEFRKSGRSSMYKSDVVQRMYRHIIAWKFASLLMSAFRYPISLISLLRSRKFSVGESIFFPLIVIISKGYAIGIAVYCRFVHRLVVPVRE